MLAKGPLFKRGIQIEKEETIREGEGVWNFSQNFLLKTFFQNKTKTLNNNILLKICPKNNSRGRYFGQRPLF